MSRGMSVSESPLSGSRPLRRRESACRVCVNVASVRDDGIHLRTWERGSGMTMACGTGACATAVAAILQKMTVSPAKVHMRGGVLTITWAPGDPIRMRGTATHVFKGEIDLEQFA